MLTSLFALTLANQTPPTMAEFSSLLALMPDCRFDEPRAIGNAVDIAFAPEGDFEAKVVWKAGDEIVEEKEVRQIKRVGTMARLSIQYGQKPIGTSQGPRSTEVIVNGKVVGKINYTTIKKTSGDAFEPKTEWYLKGPWQELAYLKHPVDTTSQQRINLVYHMSSYDLGGPGKYTVEAVMRRGTTVLASSRANEISYTQILKKDVPLMKPNKQALMVPDLKNMAGPYVVELKANGKVVRSWRGEIKNGAFVPHKRSDFVQKDPLLFLSSRGINEGGGFLDPHLRTWLAP